MGIVVAAAGLKAMDGRLGTLRAAVAASVWPATAVALREVLAGVIGLRLR